MNQEPRLRRIDNWHARRWRWASEWCDSYTEQRVMDVGRKAKNLETTAAMNHDVAGTQNRCDARCQAVASGPSKTDDSQEMSKGS